MKQTEFPLEITKPKIMKTKEQLLKEILKCESLQAQWGAKSSKLRQEYAKKYSEFQKGDKVKIENSFGDIKMGIVMMIKYDTHSFMNYLIEIWAKDFNKKHSRMHPVWVGEKGRYYNKIELIK